MHGKDGEMRGPGMVLTVIDMEHCSKFPAEKADMGT